MNISRAKFVSMILNPRVFSFKMDSNYRMKGFSTEILTLNDYLQPFPLVIHDTQAIICVKYLHPYAKALL